MNRLAPQGLAGIDLEQANLFLASAIDITSQLVSITDRENRFIFVNKAFLSTYGYTKEEIIGKHPEFLRPKKYNDSPETDIFELTSAGEWNGELINVCKDGTQIPVFLKTSIIKNLDGENVGYIGIADVITGRKEAEAALRNSQEAYRDLVENINDVIYAIDINGIFTYVSPVAERIFGHNSSELIGRLYETLIYGEDISTISHTFQDARNNHPSPAEFRILTKNGELRWVRRSTLPVMNEGKIIGTRGLLMDITEHKQAEEALRESELRFRTTVEMAPDAIFIVDAQGNIIEVNNAACQQLGYTREHLLQLRLPDIMPPSYAMKAEERLKEMRNADRTYESCHLRSDGREIAVELNIKSIIFKGKPAMVGIARDITERKRVEGKLRDFTRQILEAQENERGRVARELHDSVIQLLSASKHRLSALSEKMIKHDGEVNADLLTSLELLDKAIKETRTISRGLKPGVLEDLGLLPAVRSISEDLMQRSPVKIDLQSTLPYKRLPHDIELVLYRIVQEALNNVEKHSRANEVKVLFMFSGSSLVSIIKDDGIGFQYESSAATRSLLSGYGLVNMKERAASVGGTVEINSASNRGTEIVISIPLADISV